MSTPTPTPTAPATPTGRWLFATQNEVLTHYARPENYTDVRKLRTLRIQVFVFHASRLLLLLDPASKTWTAPSKLVHHSFSSPQTIWKVVLRMLKQTIEENKLTGIHFLDIHTNADYVEKGWKVEDDCNWKSLQQNILIMAEGERVDDRTSINCEGGWIGDMKWFVVEEVQKLKIGGMTMERVERMFGQLNIHISKQNNLKAFVQRGQDPPRSFALVGNICQNGAHIKIGLQTIYRGTAIPHSIVLIRKNMENSPITLTEVQRDIFDKIGQEYQEVISRLPLAGGRFKTTEYVVIGKILNEEVQFKRNTNLGMIKGVLGDGATLRIEWMHWNKGVKLVEGGIESGGMVKKIALGDKRDSFLVEEV